LAQISLVVEQALTGSKLKWSGKLPGFLHQHGAEVEPLVESADTLFDPHRAEGAAAATQVEPIAIFNELAEHTLHAGLDTVAGFGEGFTES